MSEQLLIVEKIDVQDSNWKGESYPQELQGLLATFNNYIEEIDKQLSLNYSDKKYVKDFYSIQEQDDRKRVKTNRNEFKKLNVHNTDEIQGLYIFAEEDTNKNTPVYVGISRTITRRIKQHAYRENHNEATLAYIIAESEKKKPKGIKREKMNILKIEEKKFKKK